MKKRIRVQVGPGIFASERSVSFRAGDTNYTLLVDADDVKGDTLEVYVIAENDKEALIDLPRDTFTLGNRIRVPKTILMPACG